MQLSSDHSLRNRVFAQVFCRLFEYIIAMVCAQLLLLSSWLVGGDAARLMAGNVEKARAEMATAVDKDLEDGGDLIVVVVDDGDACLTRSQSLYSSQVVGSRCAGDAGQLWKHEGGALKNVATGKCLQVKGFDNCWSGAHLILFTCNGQSSQQFQFNKGGIFQPKCSKCLEVSMGPKVYLSDCQSSQRQKMVWGAQWAEDWLGSLLQVEDDSNLEQDSVLTGTKGGGGKKNNKWNNNHNHNNGWNNNHNNQHHNHNRNNGRNNNHQKGGGGGGKKQWR